MRPMQRDLLIAMALLALALAALGTGVHVVERRVLRRGEQRALLELLDRAAIPHGRLVLAHPAEALFPLVPGLDLAARRLVLVSQYTATFPLYLLQGQPEIYLLRERSSERFALNLARWPAAPVVNDARHQLLRVPLALTSWIDDLERFAVARVVQGEATDATPDGDGFAYGPKRWHRLHRVSGRVDKIEHACLALHPDPAFSVRITSPLAPDHRLAQVHLAGLDSGDRSKDNKYTLTVRVRDASGRELARQARTIAGSQLRRWESLELETARGTRLEVELGVNRAGRHHLCLMGDLLR